MRLRIGYLILGCLLLIESGFLLYGEIVDGNLQSPIFVLILAISIMFLSLWYLYPQFGKRNVLLLFSFNVLLHNIYYINQL